MIFARISSEEDEEQLHTALKEALKPYIYLDNVRLPFERR